MTEFLKSKFSVSMPATVAAEQWSERVGPKREEHCEGWKPWTKGKADGREQCDRKPTHYCPTCKAWHCDRHVCACPP